MSFQSSDSLKLLRGTDIYLLDQIFKDRFPEGCSILEAGCGGGRNLAWFLKNGYQVSGVDTSAGGIAAVRAAATALAPELPSENFRVDPVESLSFADGEFDAVLSIAVLHFARSQDHFEAMLRQMWRVLRPGGLFFARLASNIGIEHLVRPLEIKGCYWIPDGSTRFLVDQETLLQWTKTLGAELIEPIKTVNVQNQRCMTTWVMRKRSG